MDGNGSDTINLNFLTGSRGGQSHPWPVTSLLKGDKPALSSVTVHLGCHTFEMPEVVPLEGITTHKRSHSLVHHPTVRSLPCFRLPTCNLPHVPSLIPNAENKLQNCPPQDLSSCSLLNVIGLTQINTHRNSLEVWPLPTSPRC